MIPFAQRIAGHAPLAIKAVKEVTQAALDETLEPSWRFGSTLRWIIGQTRMHGKGHAPSPTNATRTIAAVKPRQ